jgi:NodT family efflux transporter outer membrane factor (OMF) lipoprotein
MKINQSFALSVMALTVLSLLSGCAMGPNYAKPAVANPASFNIPAGWKMAQPQDADIPSDWWKIFNDTQLNQLEERVVLSNQTLAQKEAALRQARALVQSAEAGLFPTLNGNAAESRNKSSGGAIGLAQGRIYNNFLLNAQASWEPDLWGSVRRTIEANTANYQASASQLAAARLTLQSQLAVDYFQLRADDALTVLLTDTVKAYRQNLDLTNSRMSAGIAAETDVLQAESQLRGAEAQLIDVGVQRGQLEHAIAVLTGVAPSGFSIAPTPLGTDTVQLPISVPSAIVERRPDIAAAERAAAAASAQIGVAKAAFFPTLTLGGATGFQNNSSGALLTQPNAAWSFSPQLSLPIFDGGLRSANLTQAEAAYEGAVANYREVVLEAFQNVEDNLTAASLLTNEIHVQNQAVVAAHKTLNLTEAQYKAGIVGYLNVIVAQTTLLTSKTTEVSLRSRHYVASVQLITALGGGWNASQLPHE